MEEATEFADYLPLSFMSRRDGIPWDKTPKDFAMGLIACDNGKIFYSAAAVLDIKTSRP